MEAIGDNFFAYRQYRRHVNLAYERQMWRMTRPELEPWVDRLTGLQEGHFRRERVRGLRDYTHASCTGARGIFIWYFLAPGLYEINQRVSWNKARRYFVQSEGGILTERTYHEVLQCLKNGI